MIQRVGDGRLHWMPDDRYCALAYPDERAEQHRRTQLWHALNVMGDTVADLEWTWP